MDVTAQNIIDGLTIFQKYESSYSPEAGYDLLCAGPDPEIVSEEDLARLEKLDWIPQKGIKCFYFQF